MAKTATKREKPEAPTVTFDVQEVFAKVTDPNGKHQTISRGWVIVQTADGSRSMFCGPTFSWCPTPFTIVPFHDEETARTQMKFHIANQAERDKPREIKSVVVEIPYCELEQSGNNASCLTLRFSPAVSQLIGKVQTALEQVKAETADSVRVTSPTATVRWILEQLADSM